MHSAAIYSALIFAFLVVFAGLFWAAYREISRPIAQVLAPVIGAGMGVCGVFLVTQLQFAHQIEQRQEDANVLNSWLSGDVRNIAFQAEGTLMSLMMVNLPDGKLDSKFYANAAQPHLERHHDARVDWRLLPPAQLQHLEYIEQSTTEYRQLLGQAASSSPVPDDLQYHVIDKMQQIIGQAGAYMRIFSGPEFQVYAKQAEDIKVRQFAPISGQSFEGTTRMLPLLDRLNQIANESAKHK